ncbi:MAG: hypothetical protein ACRDF0_09955, partial [Candidatus Limnocylindria bacterium]
VHATAGLARVRGAYGDLRGAASLYEHAARRLPSPDFVAALGDVYARLADGERAEQQYALVGAMQRLLAASGVRTEIDLALFAADHARDLEASLAATRAEYAERRSVHVADALAWAEYRMGHLAAARAHSREALRLGTKDPLLLYRAGVIAHAAGDTEAAYTLLRRSHDLNPAFSLLFADDLAARLELLAAARAP